MKNVFKRVSCLLLMAQTNVVGNVFAKSLPQLGETFSLEYRYESDSGFADINECVLNRFSPQGVFLNSIVLHDFVTFPNEANVFCSNLQKGSVTARLYKLVSVENEAKLACLQMATGDDLVKPFLVNDKLCGL
jgi:hypothetical protein